ncbi:general stress protein [Salinicoccus halodurans]|uniref:General stress protein n=1 Tax=Salinicoccus halodurans TaxID=407035 RepID=A0A0F7HIW6_9STAP|nr:general stress protein [Salinicoccus halodurans]AKG72929.1 general stress protein [Salinicoccus halodurans]SFK76272.1 Heat induced stress protein YflT [Salinicoccus halodurans]
MKPFIKAYENDEKLQEDIKKITGNNVKEEDIYVISHDDDRTKRIAKNTGINTIGASEMDMGDAVKAPFEKKGDELRNKLQSVGFDETEAKGYEAEMDKGKVFLIVTNNENVEQFLI